MLFWYLSGDGIEASATVAVSYSYKVGDKVRVDLDVDTLKMMQEGHGGWNPKMADVSTAWNLLHLYSLNILLYELIQLVDELFNVGWADGSVVNLIRFWPIVLFFIQNIFLETFPSTLPRSCMAFIFTRSSWCEYLNCSQAY